MSKKTPLTAIHESLGARMVDFAGYYMPLTYQGINEEHQNVRENVGVFDCSHMGEFFVSGPNSLELVQRVTSNDASKLEVGRVQYSSFPNEQGGLVDDLLVYRMPDDVNGKVFMLVVNASNIEKDWDWVEKNNRDIGAELSNRSYDFGLLAVQGPLAEHVLQKLTDVDLGSISYYHYKIGTFAGLDDVILSATGYTGAGGFEIYAKEKDMPKIWADIFEAGAEVGIQPAGLGCRDTLRLEMGYCLYGNDIDDTTTPLEAGLGWITKLGKGDFVGREVLMKMKENGIPRRLVGFTLEGKRVPRHGYKILDLSGGELGYVTSGTMSPSLHRPIGMGYVKTGMHKKGTSILIDTGRKHLEAQIVGLPFYKSEK